MVKCSAPLCGNANYRKIPGISFHRFPKDEYMKNVWLSQMNRINWRPSSCVLCSKHFEANLLDNSGLRTVLAPAAIPTIFDLVQDENTPTSAQRDSNRGSASRERVVNVLSDVPNLQPSTSTVSLHCDTPTSTLKTPIKRSATGEYVLRDVQNLQPGTSGTTQQYGEVNQRKIQEKEINKIKQKQLLKNKKIKALKQQNRRLKNKVSKFSEIINTSKKKVNQDEFHILSGINIRNKDFFLRYLKKAENSSLSKSFSPELRSFALQLNFYSPRAYNFVRDSFNTVLPHPVTLARWYKKVDAEPGFTSESFETLEALAKNSEHKVFVNLSMDEMAIRKGLVWDATENKFKGKSL